MSQLLLVSRAAAAFIAAAAIATVSAEAQRPISARDSTAAHNIAVQSLRQFQYQHWALVGEADWEIRAAANLVRASCEVRVADFCYGPLNGRLKFGGIGTYQASKVFDTSHLPPKWRKRSDQLIDRYLGELRRQRGRIPNDIWLNGEIVRVHVESGFIGRAQSEMPSCRDVRWWCGALGAYVLHASGDWRGADSAWTGVLRQMTASERCMWLDPSPIVEDEALRFERYNATCAEGQEHLERFWWLADPLWSRPGNERRSEHLSRHVAIILDEAAQRRLYATPAMMRERHVEPLDYPLIVNLNARLMQRCGSLGTGQQTGIINLLFGYPELVMRAGVPSFCANLDQLAEESIAYATQHAPPQLSFVPAPAALRSHLTASSADWNLRPQRPYEFMAGWTRPMMKLDHQVAWFSRSSEHYLIVAANAPLPPTPGNVPLPGPRPPITGQLWMQGDFNTSPTVLLRGGISRVVFGMTARADSTLVAVELNLGLGATGLTRFSNARNMDVPSRLSISDILLVEPTQPLPANLIEAEELALGSTRLTERSVVGLYFEMYGLTAGEEPRVSLQVIEQRGVVPLRLGRDSVAARGTNAMVTEWQERPATSSGIEPRALAVDLATLPRGRYTLSIAFSVPGHTWVESVRTIEVVR